MKVSKLTKRLLPLALAVGALSACNYSPMGGYNGYKGYDEGGYEYYTPTGSQEQIAIDGEYYTSPQENPYVEVNEENNKSNVSLTSTSFAYTVIREQINNNRTYNIQNSVKLEEMLNYFSYGYVNDTENALTTHLELAECPWNNEHYLASVVVKAKPAITENVKNNIVILIDKSGSMTSLYATSPIGATCASEPAGTY